MRKLLCLSTFFTLSLFAQPTIPARLFDVKSGNGVTDNGTTYTRATVIVFGTPPGKTANQSKNAILDAFAKAYGYQETVPDPVNPGQTIPNPQSKEQFFNKQLTNYIRDVYRAELAKAAEKSAGDAAKSAADNELPPQ